MASTYCLYPFTNLNSNTEGSVKLCCSINENIHATKDGIELNFGTHSIEDIWNSEYMTTVRHQLLNGERPDACGVCWRLEDKGIQSSRQSAFAELKDWAHPKHYQTATPPLPQSLELRLGHFCNLRCNSCWSLSSDRIYNERKKIINIDKSLPQWLRDDWSDEISIADNSDWNWWLSEEFDKTIRKLAPRLKRLYLTGGEPTLIQRNIEIMQMILDSGNTDCYIALTTNLTNWNEIFFQTMRQFKHGEFQISIDHLYEKNYYIRFPTRWEKIDENIIRIYDNFPSSWKIKHYTVFQNYNWDAIPEILEWVFKHRSYWNEQEKQRLYIWSPIILDSPDYLDVRTVPLAVRQEAADALEQYQPSINVPNIWWEHGAKQAIKILRDETLDEDSRVERLQKFREYCDTLDRSRGTKWYETFHNIAFKVLT